MTGDDQGIQFTIAVTLVGVRGRRVRYLRAHDEFGVFISGAVRAGLAYASAHGISNWIVDISVATSSDTATRSFLTS